jgi:hypothetical protein
VQTYADGTTVRWIGDEGSETPAAVTVVSTSAAPQNAGGEGAATTAAQGETQDAAPSVPESESDDGTSILEILAIALGGAGLVVAVVALALTRRRPET